MKQLLIFVALLVTFLLACKNDEPSSAFMAEGEIIGGDPRNCGCCGGWFLEAADTTFLFDRLPASSSLDLNNATFPISVKFDYQADTSTCGRFYNKIILTGIEQE